MQHSLNGPSYDVYWLDKQEYREQHMMLSSIRAMADLIGYLRSTIYNTLMSAQVLRRAYIKTLDI